MRMQVFQEGYQRGHEDESERLEVRVGPVVYVLLCGGIKRNQQRDIAKAYDMAMVLKEEES